MTSALVGNWCKRGAGAVHLIIGKSFAFDIWGPLYIFWKVGGKEERGAYYRNFTAAIRSISKPIYPLITGILTFLGQNCASVPLLIYKIILYHQEKEINQIPETGTNYDLAFWKRKCESLKKVSLTFSSCNPFRPSPSMARHLLTVLVH